MRGTLSSFAGVVWSRTSWRALSATSRGLAFGLQRNHDGDRALCCTRWGLRDTAQPAEGPRDWPKVWTTPNVHTLSRQSIANLHGRIEHTNAKHQPPHPMNGRQGGGGKRGLSSWHHSSVSILTTAALMKHLRDLWRSTFPRNVGSALFNLLPYHTTLWSG